MKFIYETGLRRKFLKNARLRGTWDEAGKFSEAGSEVQMEERVAADGGVSFEVDVALAASEVGKEFRWEVIADGPLGLDRNVIATEQPGEAHDAVYRSFTLSDDPHAEQRYFLTHVTRLGAHKFWRAHGEEPGIMFAVWAPNAKNVEVVFGKAEHGYIADDGSGIDAARPKIALERQSDGIWRADPSNNPALARFSDFVGAAYMYRIEKEDGQIGFRTDLYSRAQIGTGDTNPRGKPYAGNASGLDGAVGCSLVVDPDVSRDVASGKENQAISERDFWRDEFDHATPFPHRIDELVIYELHVGSLGFGKDRPGNFEDAIELVDYLVELGVNAVELLPIAEFNGTQTWGYGNSHHFAIESSAGGRDQFRRFVRACHRRGIAVIVDVVYNHYVPEGERAQWHYDSERDEHNIYYWYEGKPSDYEKPDGGYLDNLSTGFAPRFHDEMVRKLFISSAVALVTDFHVDGFRVDQTTSIHAYNVLHADGRAVGAANVAGAKFLRELSRTLRMIRPETLLTCEDHSDWVLVTEHPDGAGLGFDATWYSSFYHHLIGDTGRGAESANLLWTAGMGGDGELAMDYFAGALGATGRKTIVYHESHDEAGNSEHSQRTLIAAIAGADSSPKGELRKVAEARCHFAAGMALLSAGTPMFLMGEEIGATKVFRYNDFMQNREDLLNERNGAGHALFRFYRDLIRLRLRHHAFASSNIQIVKTHNADRMIAFHRWKGPERYLVVATLSNSGWPDGYELEVPEEFDGSWREIFTSDLAIYGGAGVSNDAEQINSEKGKLKLKLPANGFVVLRRLPS